jgi:hypothetical protein
LIAHSPLSGGSFGNSKLPKSKQQSHPTTLPCGIQQTPPHDRLSAISPSGTSNRKMNRKDAMEEFDAEDWAERQKELDDEIAERLANFDRCEQVEQKVRTHLSRARTEHEKSRWRARLRKLKAIKRKC